VRLRCDRRKRTLQERQPIVGRNDDRKEHDVIDLSDYRSELRQSLPCLIPDSLTYLPQWAGGGQFDKYR
jgi:hypothetical protein